MPRQFSLAAMLTKTSCNNDVETCVVHREATAQVYMESLRQPICYSLATAVMITCRSRGFKTGKKKIEKKLPTSYNN